MATPACDLDPPVRHVIRTVGPVWEDGRPRPRALVLHGCRSHAVLATWLRHPCTMKGPRRRRGRGSAVTRACRRRRGTRNHGQGPGRCPAPVHPQAARRVRCSRGRHQQSGAARKPAEKPAFRHSGYRESFPYRRGLNGILPMQVTVRIVKHIVNPGEKYGKLTIIAEVRKFAPSGGSYRAALCRCDCGNELTPALRSLMSGDARSCGCSRGRPKYEWKRCPVCGCRAWIRRDRRSCSRACGHKLTGAALRAEIPSYDVWHNRVRKARGPASDYQCADCGGRAEDWSTADPSSDDVWVRFQPRCRKCHRRYDGALGEGSPRAKLTAGEVRRLRARRSDGLTYRQLADEFGISDVSAHAAVNRRTWAHVA
jgi:hypothetical protein